MIIGNGRSDVVCGLGQGGQFQQGLQIVRLKGENVLKDLHCAGRILDSFFLLLRHL